MFRWRPFLLMRLLILAAAGSSIVMAALPVARHWAGIVVLEAPARPAFRQAAPMPSVDLEPILAFAPFGRAVEAGVKATTSAQVPPDLQLKGIFAATSGASVAMIAVGSEVGLFQTNETVTGAFQLSLIKADFVELSDADRTITLGFDEARVSDDAPEPEIPVALSASLFDRMTTGLVVPTRYQKPAAPETTSEYIDYWRARIRKNPQAVLDEIGLTPTDDGYVIAPKHDLGVRLAGLKAGDLVRSVNGEQVGNPNDDRRFYDRIAASGQARLEIERGGKLLTLSFPLR